LDPKKEAKLKVGSILLNFQEGKSEGLSARICLPIIGPPYTLLSPEKISLGLIGLHTNMVESGIIALINPMFSNSLQHPHILYKSVFIRGSNL